MAFRVDTADVGPRERFAYWTEAQTRLGVTVSGWIRARRLERCRRDLEDPALAGETVLAIAARWGLRNPGHFSRLFQAAYGMTPSAVRGRASARR